MIDMSDGVVDEFPAVDITCGNILILKSGPDDQVHSVRREFEKKFPHHRDKLAFHPVRNVNGWKKLCVSHKKIMVITPHLPSNQISADRVAETVKLANRDAIVIAWTLVPIKGCNLDANLKRGRQGEEGYNQLLEMFREFFYGVTRDKLIDWLKVKEYTF